MFQKALKSIKIKEKKSNEIMPDKIKIKTIYSEYSEFFEFKTTFHHFNAEFQHIKLRKIS